MPDMVRQLARDRGVRRLVVAVRLPGEPGRAMAGGGLLPDSDGPRGRLTFAQWLDAAGARSRGAGVTGVRSRHEGELAAAYQRARPRLLRLAYATLGSRTEAEDVVSECWLRLAGADAREPVRDVEGWAVRAVARAALDTLRSARLRRDLYIGPWLPEPVVEFTAGNCDPADRVSLDDA